jgi:hypothetical protein
MDKKISEFNALIETHKNKYSNICSLWKEYIDIKQKKFETQMDIAIKKLKILDSVLDNDISIENLLLLSIAQELDINN